MITWGSIRLSKRGWSEGWSAVDPRGGQLDSARLYGNLASLLETVPMDDRPDRTRNAAQRRAQPDAEVSDPMRVILAIVGVLGAMAVLAMNVAD